MTIAGVYLSPEGVVFGADSTASAPVSEGGFHFYDFNQKLFEIGDGGTLATITWGLAALSDWSYRTLLALFNDELAQVPPASVGDAAQRWVEFFWQRYEADPLVQHTRALKAKADAGGATSAELHELAELASGLSVGFCIAGYVPQSRIPEAHHMMFGPLGGQPAPAKMAMGSIQWWGVPNFFSRLLFGADANVLNDIEKSGKWTGTRAELDAIVRSHASVPSCALPIRDAIDYVHTCIHCTVKAIKFSGLPQVCGGPIELAVITTDRRFRWVRHKAWDAAIGEGVN